MMKKSYRIFYVCIIGMLFTSCDELAQSVEWYKQHEAERKLMLGRCQANPDLMNKNRNCRNAADAEIILGNYTKSSARSWGVEDGVR